MKDIAWRAEPDSNRLPPAVLQVCFRKHLPSLSPVFPGCQQAPVPANSFRRACTFSDACGGDGVPSCPTAQRV